MNTIECKCFISAFKAASQSEERRYIFRKNYAYEYYDKKYSFAFKVKDIESTAQKSIAHLSSEDCKVSLEKRISLLEDLTFSLKVCAGRIENSIKKRWWYWILHFFGYQAKCPPKIAEAIKEAQDSIIVLKEANKKDLESIKPFDFGALPKELQEHCLSFNSYKDHAKLKEVSQQSKTAIEEYEVTFEAAFQAMKERGEDRAEKCIFYFNKVLDNPELENILKGNEKLKTKFFQYILKIDFEKISERIPKFINLFFDIAPDAELTLFIFKRVLLVDNLDEFEFPRLNETFLSSLNDQRINRILSLNLPLKKSILKSLALCKDTGLEPLVNSFFNKFPDSPFWAKIRNEDNSISGLRAYLLAYEVISLLNQAKDDQTVGAEISEKLKFMQKEEFLKDFTKFYYPLLKHFEVCDQSQLIFYCKILFSKEEGEKLERWIAWSGFILAAVMSNKQALYVPVISALNEFKHLEKLLKELKKES